MGDLYTKTMVRIYEAYEAAASAAAWSILLSFYCVPTNSG